MFIKENIKKPLIFLLSLSLFAFAGCNWGTDGTTNGDTNGNGNGADSEAKGEIFISVTDAAVDLTNIEEVQLDVDDVSVYSATEGWTSLNVKNNDFDLLSLKAGGDSKLLAQEELKADTYSRLRLNIGAVEVDKDEDNEALDVTDENAVLASEQLEFDANIKIMADRQTHVELDFIVDESLHTATNEDDEQIFVFLPVIEISSTSNTSVQVDNSENVSTTGGAVDDSFKAGTDSEGNTEKNFSLEEDADITVDSDGNIQIDVTAGTQLNSGTNTGSNSTNTNNDSGLKLNGNVDVNGGLY